MKNISRILVVVTSQDDGEIVLGKALRLAAGCGAEVHLCQVVYEGIVDFTVSPVAHRDALKARLLDAAGQFLARLVADLQPVPTVPVECRAVWHRVPWQGALDLARELRADLVIKATEPSAHEFLRTPQDWNLLRHATVPVMLLKPEPWPDAPEIVAAIDADADDQARLSGRIVESAGDIRDFLGGTLTLIDAFPRVEHWLGPVTLAIDFNAVRRQARNEVGRRLEAIARHHHVVADQVRVEEGEPFEVIAQFTQRRNAALLVMGTVQRSGAHGRVMGNTSEMILHHVHSDVLVIC